MAVVAPIPTASVKMPVNVNPGLLRNWRKAERKSWSTLFIVFSRCHHLVNLCGEAVVGEERDTNQRCGAVGILLDDQRPHDTNANTLYSNPLAHTKLFVCRA